MKEVAICIVWLLVLPSAALFFYHGYRMHQRAPGYGFSFIAAFGVLIVGYIVQKTFSLYG